MRYEGCRSESDAAQREKYLKTAWGKRYIKNRPQQLSHGVNPLDTKALITTYLEMRSPEQLRPKKVTTGKWRVRELKQLDDGWRFNREMYFRVGKQWQWVDKRPWTDEQWQEYAAASGLRTFAAFFDDTLAGYYELRRESKPDGRDAAVEIAYFGLLPQFIGRGLGGALLTSAIEEAWSRRGGIAPVLVWVHTCNRDHPQALANYQARGMVVYKVEESNR